MVWSARELPWEVRITMTDESRIAERLLDLIRAGGPGVGLELEEAARAVCIAPADWREMTPKVRRAAGRLQRDLLIHVTQRGRVVDATETEGPISLSLPMH